VLQGLLLNEAVGCCSSAPVTLRGRPGRGRSSKPWGSCLAKALDPFAHGGIGKVEGRGDDLHVMARHYLTDGLHPAKDADFSGLFAHGF
jgi:hypothetical protein